MTLRGSTPSVEVPGRRDDHRGSGTERDIRRFWSAYAVSAAGSGIGAGALPLVAILVLHASDWQVSLLAVWAGLAGIAVTLPLGPWIEFHPKRPTMIGADLLRFAALASIPIAAVLGALSYPLLCVVAVVQTAGTIVSTAASTSYLKALAPPGQRVRVTSWLETTTWTTGTLGTLVGGILVSATSPIGSVIVDAVSYLLSAAGWRRIKAREPAPPQPSASGRRWVETVAGWRYIWQHRRLRALFGNAMIFGGIIMASTPLIAVYLLRDLGFTPMQYGLALGVPCAAGILGSLLAPMLIRRAGLTRTLLIAGAARCVWMAPILLAPPSTGGLLLIIAADSALLLCAGVFNPTFATYRMSVTADNYLARVVAAWAISSKTSQPVCIAAAGLLAAATSIRTAIAVLAVALLGCALWLPWRMTDTESADIE